MYRTTNSIHVNVRFFKFKFKFYGKVYYKIVTSPLFMRFLFFHVIFSILSSTAINEIISISTMYAKAPNSGMIISSLSLSIGSNLPSPTIRTIMMYVSSDKLLICQVRSNLFRWNFINFKFNECQASVVRFS